KYLSINHLVIANCQSVMPSLEPSTGMSRAGNFTVIHGCAVLPRTMPIFFVRQISWMPSLKMLSILYYMFLVRWDSRILEPKFLFVIRNTPKNTLEVLKIGKRHNKLA